MFYKKVLLKEIDPRFDNEESHLRIYIADENESVSKRPGMLVCPGGGYSFCSEREGENVACRFLSEGFNCFVLYYTVNKKYPAPQLDLALVFAYIRQHEEEFKLLPNTLSIIGFSAGGHLAAIPATSSQDALYDRVDAVDDLPAHLNFSIPVYPAYVLDDGPTGRNERCGDGAAILPEFKFDAKTPPMCMVHGDKDFYSPMASVQLYTELHKRKIPAQLFVYANVSHGLGDKVNVAGWQRRVVDWIESIGF